MRIKDIQVDRFGVWRALSLPLNERGVTVFYGPNGAGKSTLMRFVRGVLFGFDSREGRITDAGATLDGKGSLRIIHDGREHRIHREADAAQRGRVRVDDLESGALSEDHVTSFLGGTSESLFESIFAIGLHELQELATLDGEEVAQHIYGLSLGPDGERVLRGRDQFAQARVRLISDDHKSGDAAQLARRMAEIDRELAEVNDASDKHRHLRSERRRLTAEIEQAQRRRRDLEDNLRGHRYLARVHGPWLRQRELNEQRAALPDVRPCPADGLERYDALTSEIDEHSRRRASLRQEARQLLRKVRRSAGDATLIQHECTIRRLAEERDDIRRREQRIKEHQSRAADLKRQWESNADGRIGCEWAETPNEPVLANSLVRLLASARAYQQAQSSKKRAVKRYRTLVAGAQKRQSALTERLKSLGTTSPDAAAKSLQRQLSMVDELNRLRLDEARLLGQRQAPERTSDSGRQPRSLLNGRDLPPLFYLVMWFFTMAGATLFVLGLWGAATERVAAGNTAWIVGGIYACFGLCMSGVSWSVRRHFEQSFAAGLVGDATFSFAGKVEQTPPLTSDVDEELSGVRRSLRDLVRRTGLPGIDVKHGELAGADVIRRMSIRLAELEQLRQQQGRVQSDRQRLSRYRERLRHRQRDVGRCRRQWCDVLRDLGLEETLKVEQAIEQWQAALEVRELRRKHSGLLEAIERDRKVIDAHNREVDRLNGLLTEGGTAEDVHSAAGRDRLIAQWMEAVRRSVGVSAEQTRLRREARNKRKEAARLASSIHDLASQRRLLLVEAGVSTREELEQGTQSFLRHQELSRLIEDAQLELQLIAEEEPDLALVEEDLLAFHPGENKRRITDAEIEIKQIDRDLQTAREELGRVKREMAELANDRRSVSLRFEREQVAGELRGVIERWCALDLAIDSLDRIRQRMERHGQSETLQLASRYLSQLTVGRYHNIWAPLGERHLCIDDDADQSLRAEQLSTGTREQLFLAIRLAMARRFAQQGIELPMVLDDVLVNFDQTRTEAAVETILDVADAGQQVLLFTCHLHLADVFESKGVDAVWLPSSAMTGVERKAG